MILYLYPEEWTGHRAREVHTLSTCVALARAGHSVSLVTAGGEAALRAQVRDISGVESLSGLELVALSRRFGPIRSAAIFDFNFNRWLRNQKPFERGFTIHLKAASMLRRAGIPYLFEAHEAFAETPRPNDEVQHLLEQMEREALAGASWRVATSAALAGALVTRYSLRDDFSIVPNAGGSPLKESIAHPDGPFVYCGSIADWKGLEFAVEGARQAMNPLRVIGGSNAEWSALGKACDTSGVEWRPRVSLTELPSALRGARAGLISTQPESGSGRYSCPMKLFDYARCGLPVISTTLPALHGLDLGPWCTLVSEPSVDTWTKSLSTFSFDGGYAEAARQWSAGHTWEARARRIAAAFATHSAPE